MIEIEHDSGPTIIATDEIVISIPSFQDIDVNDENFIEELIAHARKGTEGYAIHYVKGDILARTEPHITY